MDKKIKKIVAVSGGFDPVHIGHVRLFREAKKLGDQLVVLVNNDHWVKKKKGIVFMPESDRVELISAIKDVDKVVLTGHKVDSNDMSVCNELKEIRPHIFANGGDRKGDNVPEVKLCKDLGIDLVFNIGKGGKVRSSSWYLRDYHEAVIKKQGLTK